jgi:hypothetical protein
VIFDLLRSPVSLHFSISHASILRFAHVLSFGSFSSLTSFPWQISMIWRIWLLYSFWYCSLAITNWWIQCQTSYLNIKSLAVLSINRGCWGNKSCLHRH